MSQHLMQKLYSSHVDKVILGLLFLVFFSVSYMRYDYGKSVSNVLCCSDPMGYYIYLPAVFVYGIHNLPDTPFTGQIKNEKGETYTKYSCGTAYFQLPFFLGAHLYTRFTHRDSSGFGAPYCYSIMLCGVSWAIAGLFTLRKLLLRHFSRKATWGTLLSIVAGTNFFNYATLEIGMSHIYNFALCAAALLATDSYYKNPGKAKAISLGILYGWLILARPTNIVMLLIVVLYRIASKDDLRERVILLKKRFTDIAIAIPFALVMWVPQFLYWKSMTGHWFRYSYDQERFTYWKSPKILSVLFDTQNGCFLYSPLLLFMFWAIIKKRKDKRTNFWAVTIVFTISTYLFASWWAWSFSGAFGHRCYVDYYPLYAFPIAVTAEGILQLKNRFWKGTILFFAALLCYYVMAASQIYMYLGRPFSGSEWVWNWDTWLDLVRKAFFVKRIE